MGLDRTCHAHQFIFSFFFFYVSLFISCGKLSWLSISFLLHVKYTVSYRIVSQLKILTGRVVCRFTPSTTITRTDLDTLVVSEAKPWTTVDALVVKHVVRRVLLTLDTSQSNSHTQSTNYTEHSDSANFRHIKRCL